MQEKVRYYIRSKYAPSNFLAYIDFNKLDLRYVCNRTYMPNIKSYPISFVTLESMEDYIYNKIIESLKLNYSISSLIFNQLACLEIAYADEFTDKSYFRTYNLPFNVIETFVQRSYWRIKFNINYPAQIIEAYKLKTQFNSRSLFTTNGYSSNKYYIYCKKALAPASDGIQQELRNLEIDFDCEHINYVIVTIINSLEDLNLWRITSSFVDNYDIIAEQDLIDSEIEITSKKDFCL